MKTLKELVKYFTTTDIDEDVNKEVELWEQERIREIREDIDPSFDGDLYKDRSEKIFRLHEKHISERKKLAEDLKKHLADGAKRRDPHTFDSNIDLIFSGKLIDGLFNFGSKRDPQLINVRYREKDPEVVTGLFRSFLKKRFPDFAIDKSNEEAIKYLVDIYTGKSDKRGLVVSGNTGSGKTLLLKLWIYFRKYVLRDERAYSNGLRSRSYVFYDPLTLLKHFQKDQYDIFSKRLGDVLILDDIGLIPPVNYFGTMVDIAGNLIFKRYDDTKEDPQLELYLTTNLTPDQLKTALGERTISRLAELTEIKSGVLAGVDRRKIDTRVGEWNLGNIFFDPLAVKT